MEKRIILNWERYQEDPKLFLLVEAFLFHGWKLVIARESAL
jgi:hypothetical protein